MLLVETRIVFEFVGGILSLKVSFINQRLIYAGLECLSMSVSLPF